MKQVSAKSIFAGLACVATGFVLAWFILVHVPECFDGSSPADFPNYYFAGLRLFEDRPIYADLHDEVQKSLGWDYNLYPADVPFAIVALSPLSLLAYKTAWWTLAIFSLLAACWVVFFTSKETQISSSATALALSAALCCTPFLILLKRNHFEMLLVLCSVLGWILLRRGRPYLSALFFGLAGALKLFPALWLVVIFIVSGKRPFFFGCITFAVLSMVGALFVGADNVQQYIFHIIPRSAQWYGTVANYSVLSLASALGSPLFGWMFSIAVMLLAFYELFCGTREPTSVWIRVTVLSLLLSPLSWLNYFVLIVPIAIVVLAETTPGSRRRLYTCGLFTTLLFWPSYIPTQSATLTILLAHAPTFGLGILYMTSRKPLRPLIPF